MKNIYDSKMVPMTTASRSKVSSLRIQEKRRKNCSQPAPWQVFPSENYFLSPGWGKRDSIAQWLNLASAGDGVWPLWEAVLL